MCCICIDELLKLFLDEEEEELPLLLLLPLLDLLKVISSVPSARFFAESNGLRFWQNTLRQTLACLEFDIDVNDVMLVKYCLTKLRA
jgi:hypothetical protein